MVSIMSFFFDLLGYIGALFLGAITTLLAVNIVEPYTEMVFDTVKNSDGFMGRLYYKYTETIGRFLFFRKSENKMHTAFRRKGREYKLYKYNGVVTACQSTIMRLDQNFMGRIRGVMIRNSPTKKNYRTYFKGFLKDSEQYLTLEERYKEGEGYRNIISYYKLAQAEEENSIGISIEERNGEILSSLSILSFKENFGYPNVERLLASVEADVYLERCGIHQSDLKLVNGNFGCNEN